MKISTRLILHLAVAVSVVLIVASLMLLRQRERSLKRAAEDEIRAHAVTLRIALEEDYAANQVLDAQRLINRLRENAGIHSVLLFNLSGNIELASHSNAPEEVRDLKEARQVISSGEKIEMERKIGGEDVFSIIMPLKVSNKPVGALEIAQSISFVREAIAQMRREILLMVLLLGATIFLVVLVATHYSLKKPIEGLLGGAAAMGRGELSHRVTVPQGGGELAELAENFNRMAESLVKQRRQAEREAEERLSLERKLRHSERLAAVGHLAAGVAHEMGAPLQVIDGRAKQLLHHSATPAEPHQRNLTIIRNQAERITNIVRNLLNLSRTYELHRRVVNLSTLMTETIELVEPKAELANVLIEKHCSEFSRADADPNLLQQAFLNILTNAIQAMPQGGRLRIDSLEAIRDEKTFAAIRFADTGEGIPLEHLNNIFNPFFTTKEVGHGTGLGLAVSSRIVVEHGGWIEAQNNPEGGATFTVFVPSAGNSISSSTGDAK